MPRIKVEPSGGGGGGASLDDSSGATADAYASLMALSGAGGLVGSGTVKNTGGVNDMTVKRTVTDAFGGGDNTEDVVTPGASFSYDISEAVGAAVPPYTDFDVSVKSTTPGNSTNYSFYNTSVS